MGKFFYNELTFCLHWACMTHLRFKVSDAIAMLVEF